MFSIKSFFFTILTVSVFYAIWKTISLSSEEKHISFALNENLFTDSERRFYKALTLAVHKEYLVQAKIRFAKFANAKLAPELEGRMSPTPGLRRLSQKRFDFLLLDHGSGQLRLVVELENRPHDSPKRQERNELIVLVCESLGVPLLFVQARPAYDVDELRNLVGSAVPLDKSQD